MYAPNAEQAVNIRSLAVRMRGCARQTADSYYRRLFQDAALELESAADRLERRAWRPPLH
jgi:hypothetical protein